MKKILIIEDEEPIRAIVGSILRIEGYSVIEAENGKIGLEMIHAEKPDLVICDIMMPVMDGYDTLTELRSDPETAGLPFIFLTAVSSRASRRLSKELGANEYVLKPFKNRDLLQIIRNLLEK